MVFYVPPEGDPSFPRNTEQFGYRFEGGNPVSVSDPGHLRKFAGNPYFVVQ